MNHGIRIALASALAILLSGCSSGGATLGMGGSSPIEDKEGQSVYTQRNLWFHEGEHEATNYAVSTRLPVNSEVTITATTAETISLKTSDGKEYVIINVPDYTKKDIQGIYSRYFGPSKVDLSRFSGSERQAIRDGRIEKGMSKEAVLVARGYPPAHETPSTDSDEWRFWKSAHNTRIIRFENGQVASIKD